MDNIRNWLKVTRVQTALVTSLSLWVGYVTVSQLSLSATLNLGIIGILVHIWGFCLNEVEDYEYDKMYGDSKGHPIAKGKINPTKARILSWWSALIAVIFFVISSSSIIASIIFISSFIPGYLYDKFSKKHWWSNFYLSGWVSLMVLSGALYAGSPTSLTILMMVVLAIQIFIQVIEGDLKDIRGPESTLAEVLGVSSGMYENNVPKLDYSKKFKTVITVLKVTEMLLLWSIVIRVTNINRYSEWIIGWSLLMLFVSLIFLYSLDRWMHPVINEHGREKIKKYSSIHEISSIFLIALSIAWIDMSAALILGVAPPLWYALVNKIIHTSSLSPDI